MTYPHFRSPGFRVALVALVTMFLAAPAAQAEQVIPLQRAEEGAPLVAQDAATLNLIYDDGEADDGLNATFPNTVELAMRFDAGEAGALNQVQVCLQRLDAADSGAGSIGINVYNATANGPGAVLGEFSATLSGLGVTGIPGSIRTFGLQTPLDVPASFYLGVVMDSEESDFYLCVDTDGSSRPIYASGNGGAWENLAGILPDVTKLMVRARVETAVAPPDECDAGPDAITLLNGRFRVDACYSTANGDSGTGKLSVVDGTGATLWFFNANNPELFVKVRNACVNPFNRYWFFAAGLTNVEVTITVTDLVADQKVTYQNPQGNPFASVQDTGSFDTCP